MTVYLDQAAAARPAPEAIEFYFARVRENYANQEAAHRLGHDARQQLDRAAEELSLALTGDPGWKVIWGGCGTELFNLFADSPLAAGKCAITSPLEHPALLAVLRRSAAELRLLRPDRCGRILPEELPAGDLLALHQVQSELGTIQPIGPLAEAFRRNSPAGILFVDAIQGAAKLPFPREADIVAVSGRKFGAPGGGAALLIRPAFRGGKTLLEFAGAGGTNSTAAAARRCRPCWRWRSPPVSAQQNRRRPPGASGNSTPLCGGSWRTCRCPAAGESAVRFRRSWLPPICFTCCCRGSRAA